MKISFYRNSGAKNYEMVTEFHVEAESLSEAFNILQQQVKDNEHPVTVEVTSNTLYSSWSVGSKEYFDNYFWNPNSQ